VQGAGLAHEQKDTRMSVTHPDARIASAPHHDFAGEHPQLMPFLVAAALVAVSVVVALAFTGLPA